MTDLIERMEIYCRTARGESLFLMQEAIEALSPVLPDKVAEMVQWLDEYTEDDPMHSAVNSHYKLRRILKMLERQQREIRKLKRRPSVASFNALQEECDGRMVAIKKLQQRIEELESAHQEIADGKDNLGWAPCARISEKALGRNKS